MSINTISNSGTSYSLTGIEDASVVVLIHGLGLTHRMWDQYLPMLEKNYRVLAYDLLGHGDSRPPEKAPSLASYSKQLCDLMDELKIETAALIGFSLGGMINRRFAMNYPARASVLGIFNSPHERSPEAQKQVEQRAADTRDGGPGATLQATLERWFTSRFRAESQDVVQQIAAYVLANDTVAYAQCRQVLATGVIELIRPNSPLDLPVLVITCEHDSGSTPAMSYAIASEISGAEVVVIPVLQHMGVVEQPALFIEPLLKFLNSAHKL